MSEDPLRVAIVGSGPSGFFAAGSLLKAKIPVQIDIFELYPVPYGLVRSGVAPDHPKIKSVTAGFDKIAAEECVSFLGNVEVGKDISVEELKQYYDAVILANGADTDRSLGLEGEDLPGSCAATAFVGWYNGHPRYTDETFDLSGERAVVIGQGNVAVDVARILAKTPDELKDTDIAQHALEALAESKIKEIYMIGRRGPVQAAFTDKEIREMGELADCDVYVDPGHMILSETDEAELEAAGKGKATRNIPILRDFSDRTERTKSKLLVIDFFKSPSRIIGGDKVEGIELVTNKLVGEAGAQKAVATEEKSTLDCDLILRSIGYHGTELKGVPFDSKRGVYVNEGGRVLNGSGPCPGLYVSGWIKRGPSGVIGTNKADSAETVKALLEDLDNLPRCENRDTGAVIDLLASRDVRVVSFQDWEKINQVEVDAGKAVGKPREKFTTVAEMLEVLG